jgi:hypothetical protein
VHIHRPLCYAFIGRARWSSDNVDPRFAGSNPAEDNGFLRVIKIRSTTSFVGELKLSVPCRKILRHVKEPCEYKIDTS